MCLIFLFNNRYSYNSEICQKILDKKYICTVHISELGTHSFFPGSLSAHFLPMDCYRSTAHFADFQVRSSLNRSLKTSGSLLKKSAKTLNRS